VKKIKYTLWIEGFACTGEKRKASYLGTYKAVTFQEALNKHLKKNNADKKLYTYENGKHYIWKCQVFDNEKAARVEFG